MKLTPVTKKIGSEVDAQVINAIEKYKEKTGELGVYNGKDHYPCERDTSWDKQLEIDLMPYLKDGENILKMKILVSGLGEGWIKIKAKQQCCANDEWMETWEENCEQ